MTLGELADFWGTRENRVRFQKHGFMFIAGLVLSLIGPYDTSNMPEAGMRIGYWTSLTLLASFVSGPLMRWLHPRLKPETNIWMAILELSALVSLPVYLVVISYDMYLGPGGEFTLEHTVYFLADIEYGLLGYLIWFIQVIIITLMLVTTISFTYGVFRKSELADVENPQARPGQRFLNRLPKEIGTDLLCLNVEDHYVRAYTSKGNALILMRFSDAIAELEDYSGQQTHRSWWVSYDAIAHTSREKRRYVAHLANDMDVPISQTYADKLREAGFI